VYRQAKLADVILVRDGRAVSTVRFLVEYSIGSFGGRTLNRLISPIGAKKGRAEATPAIRQRDGFAFQKDRYLIVKYEDLHCPRKTGNEKKKENAARSFRSPGS